MFPGLWALSLFSFVKGILMMVSYVANNAFPQPLSRKEEAKYLELLGTGDENAFNVLTERNLRLVAHIVKKYDSTGEETDDLISIGTIGLIKAVKNFNPKKGTRLATYAARCIENEILRSITVCKLLYPNRYPFRSQQPVSLIGATRPFCPHDLSYSSP